MSSRLRILVCRQFLREAQALAQERDFADIIVGAYPDLCVHPQTARFAMDPELEDIDEQEVYTILVGVCFLSTRAFAHLMSRVQHVHHLDQCFYLFAGRTLIDQYLREGAYLLTPGWLSDWQGHLAQWGFDQPTARAFFRECASRLVLLDTGVDGTAATHLHEFASFLDLPASVTPTGLDHFRLLLQNIVLHWRLDHPSVVTDTAVPERQALAEYIMAFDLLVQLTRIMDESEAIQAIIMLVTMLYGAGRVSYLPVEDSRLGEPIASGAAPPSINPDDIRVLLHERSYLEHAQGFSLRIGTRDEIVGILDIADIPYPERMREYLNLALAISPLCGLAIANARAITARTRAEAALQEKSDALARSNAELEQFAYIASHDLQAPLRRIVAFGDLIQQRYQQGLEPTAREYFQHMQSSAQRMQQLIQDLLEYARVDTRGDVFTRVALDALLARVLVDLEQTIADSGGQVIVGSLPTILSDERQMQQLFQNLIANALKFSRPGVPPIVHVTGLLHEDGGAEIAVKDNGIGFDEQYFERICKPFQRLHTQEAFPGTGIGLAICQKIVARHGGTLTARSREGEGATFLIQLPGHQHPDA